MIYGWLNKVIYHSSFIIYHWFWNDLGYSEIPTFWVLPSLLSMAQPLWVRLSLSEYRQSQAYRCGVATQSSWAILKRLYHTRVSRSRLGNTQNLGISECPKSFQNPFMIHRYCWAGRSFIYRLNKYGDRIPPSSNPQF